MKKILALLLAAAMLLSLTAAVSAESERPVQEVDETMIIVLDVCNHDSLTHHPAATYCAQTGNVEYWQCDYCGRTFSDDAAQNELTEIAVAPLGHDALYSATENVITETCTRCDHVSTATITACDAPYTGSAAETASVAYSPDWAGGKLTIEYANNVNAGAATASVTIGGATAQTTFNICKEASGGDMDGNGTINMRDLLTLRQYLAGGYGVDLTVAVGDLDGNGSINMRDLLTLRQYLAGGYGVDLGGGGTYEPTAISFTSSNVKLLGRAQATDSGVVVNFPGDGVEFLLDCSGDLTVGFTTGSNATYTAFVDGVEAAARASLTTTETDAVVYTGIEPGLHTVRIVQDTEVKTNGTLTVLTGVTATAKGDMYATPYKDLYIEFLGDSITAGCGTLGDPSTEWTAATHAGSKSYGYFTAEKLNADHALIAKGGIGVTKPNTGSNKNVTIEDMYIYQNAWYSELIHRDTRRTPDVVVIGMGANDAETNPDTVFHDGLLSYAETVRAEVGRTAKIVLIYGMMSGKHAGTPEAVCSELGGAENGYYVFRMPTLVNGVPAKVGGTPHPSAADNEISSDALAAYLRTIL
ncbi:MAG: hypothetical protein IJT18_03960 [Oscillospiraceae bacterium]|nr:hypothetical protein [Oscillospiraceae bacterium]